MHRFRPSDPSTLPPQETPISHRSGRTRRLVIALALTVLLPVLFVALALPAYGAVVLEYFNAVPSSSAVLLEWSTASEYNVAGFEVYCKKANEPASAYHRIGFFNAKGNATQGAQYDMLVTQLEPGAAYCFRLKEITTNDEPGESRELCGYGLSMTPTPTTPFVPSTPMTTTAVVTPTVVLFPAPTAPGLLTPTPTFDPALPTPLPTPTIDPLFSPLATPTLPAFPPTLTVTISPTPLGAVPVNPVVASTGGEASIDAVSLTMTADPLLLAQQQAQLQATPDPNILLFTPTPDPLLAQPQSPLATPTVPLTQTVAPTLTLAPTVMPSTILTGSLQSSAPADAPASGAPPIAEAPAAEAAAPAASMPGEAAPPAEAAPVADAQPTPTALYVVVTAAPPAQEGQGIAPVVTPWPTATPAAPFQLANLTAPTAQNLTVMLLCFIFISASGLGVLGLITSIVYMRSRSQRDLDELRVRYRRRI